GAPGDGPAGPHRVPAHGHPVVRAAVDRGIGRRRARDRARGRRRLRAGRGGDFVIDVASAIPFRVMAHLTGVPRSAERMVMRWGNAIAPNADPEYRPTPDAAAVANEELGEFLGEQFEQRRRAPRDDLLSQLLQVRRDGDPLPEADLRGFAVNYLLGGTETTRNLIAKGMRTLPEHPGELRRFAE